MKDWFKKFFNLKNYPVKYQLVMLVGFLILCGIFSWLYLSTQVDAFFDKFGIKGMVFSEKGKTQEAEAKQTEFYRRFDGLQVDDKIAANLWPVAVVIENLRMVRPQYGLSEASLVYETLAEGGATRFLVLFTGGSKAPIIGPVRSARPYYLDWSYEYAALYAHAGGSPQALGNIRDYDTNDLEALSRDNIYFWRDTTSYAPHNLFTSGEKLTFALRDKELLDKESTTRMWLFKDDAQVEERGEDQKFYKIKFSSYTYEVEWKYIKEENMYLRYNADEVQRDANNAYEIKAKNIIVQIVPSLDYFSNKGRIDMITHGEGKAYVLRDGQVIEGTWKKSERTTRTLFYNSEGDEIEFNRGPSWIEVLPEDREVEW